MNLNYFVKQKNIFSLIISLIPFSFFLGNSAVNINLFVLFLTYLFFFKKIHINFEIHIFDKIIFLYFCYTLLVSLIGFGDNFFLNNLNFKTNLTQTNFNLTEKFFLKNYNFYIFLKTIFYLRFLLLYIIIRNLFNKNLIRINWFVLTSSIICFFVILDIFFQFIFNKDIFGFTPVHPRKLSGPFGEELIAGGFIQRFSLFLFFGLSFVLSKNNQKKIYLLILILFIFLGIVFTGNRFPLILFLISLILVSFFKKKLINVIMIFFLTLIIVVPITLKNNEIRINYLNFKNEIINIYQSFTFKTKDENKINSDYFYEFNSFYETWKVNKYFGGGLRSFRIICPSIKRPEGTEHIFCNTHPHNYYLEILTDLGFFGLVIFGCLYFYIICLFYKKYSKLKKKFSYFLLPSACTLFVELFPIRSSGSFFTNSNAIFIFIMISFVAGLLLKKS